MSYIEKVLQPDERVIAFGRKHWIIYLAGIFFIVLGVLSWSFGSMFYPVDYLWDILGGIIALFGFLALFRAWFEQWTTEIAVTNRRVVYKAGFISRKTTEMNMEKIESVAVDQNLWGRIFDYGTVQVRGTGAGIDQLNLIANPLQLRNAIVVR